MLLKEDIRKNGQRLPIELYEAKILDGWNRYLACQELGIEPVVQDWNGEGSPIDYSLTSNYFRRHLTVGQRAMIAVEADRLRDAENRARQRRHQGARIGGAMAGRGRPKSSPPGDNSPPANLPEGCQARDEIAAQARVSARSVQDAIYVRDADPGLARQVRAGGISLAKAAKMARRTELLVKLDAIPGLDPTVVENILDLPIARKDSEVERLAELDPDHQIAVVRILRSGEAKTVSQGIIAANSYRDTPEPIPIDPREETVTIGQNLCRKLREVFDTLGYLRDYEELFETLLGVLAGDAEDHADEDTEDEEDGDNVDEEVDPETAPAKA
ncbi:MAG: hypothetical protein GXY83_19945 [Rhodopirellula sp.]|nr:hypothetical protein [Rhodopirellula sp.]